jgi:hypothetical protein
MKNYGFRSLIIFICFMDLVICLYSVWNSYFNFADKPAFPTAAVFWACFFFSIIGLISTHTKENIWSALVNIFILCCLSIPIVFILLATKLIFEKDKLNYLNTHAYLLLCIATIMYITSLPQRTGLVKMFANAFSYVKNQPDGRINPQFFKYILIEVSFIVICAFVIHFNLVN